MVFTTNKRMGSWIEWIARSFTVMNSKWMIDTFIVQNSEWMIGTFNVQNSEWMIGKFTVHSIYITVNGWLVCNSEAMTGILINSISIHSISIHSNSFIPWLTNAGHRMMDLWVKSFVDMTAPSNCREWELSTSIIKQEQA